MSEVEKENKSDKVEEEIVEEKPKRGRPKGNKNKKKQYKLLMYDIKTKKHEEVKEFASFHEMEDYFEEEHKLEITYSVFTNISSGKTTFHNLFKIEKI